MGCDAKIKSDSYDFFKDIENYIKKANDAQQNKATTEITSNCEGFYRTMESSFEDKQIGVSVCESIIKLYKSLNNIKPNSECSEDYIKDGTFFNYLVNFKIAQGRSNEIDSTKNIFNGIESHFMNVHGYDIDINFIYDIERNDLNKMNILYNLYENYGKIKAIIDGNSGMDDQSLYSHSTACCTDYFKTSYICDADNKSKNLKFCEKLETFVSKYRGLYNTVVQKGPPFTENFVKLEECHNPKIITTAVTGTVVGLIPLFGVLYKFTPMGQVIRSKMGILNNDISNNDEEMTKITLMEQENEPIRFQKDAYNIKYQSL